MGTISQSLATIASALSSRVRSVAYYRTTALVILMACAVLTGCSLNPFAPVAPVRYTSDKVTYTVEAFERDLRNYQSATGNIDLQTQIRNDIIFRTVHEIDRNYEQFSNRFYVGRGTAETTGDIVQIGLSTAGTLAGGETTKAILHAAVTSLAGARLSFEQNFFKEQAADIVLNRMDALRAEQRAVIYSKLRKKADEYSLYEAETDLLMFYAAGTVKAAFQNIAAQSGVQFTASEKDIKAAIEARFGPRLNLPEDPVLKEDLTKRIRNLQRLTNRTQLAAQVLIEYDPSLKDEPNPVQRLNQIVLDVSTTEAMKKLQAAFEKAGVKP